MPMLTPDNPIPRCPICGRMLCGAAYPGNGEVSCDQDHYKGYAWSSFRGMVDGIALTSEPHPVAPWWKFSWLTTWFQGLRKSSMEPIMITVDPASPRGDRDVRVTHHPDGRIWYDEAGDIDPRFW